MKKWYDEHWGPNLVKQEDGQYFVWLYGGWQKASEEVYEETKSSKPSNAVSISEDVWKVRFFTKLGPSTNEITIDIEPASGQVLAITGLSLQ